jgi:hypothetical protein
MTTTESKFPPISWPPFDHTMTAGPHARFVVVHDSEPRRADPNDPDDILNALHLAVTPLGWQIAEMEFVNPAYDVPPAGREKVVAKLDELIAGAQRLRQNLIDDAPAEHCGWMVDLEGDGDEIRRMLLALEEAEADDEEATDA